MSKKEKLESLKKEEASKSAGKNKKKARAAAEKEVKLEKGTKAAKASKSKVDSDKSEKPAKAPRTKKSTTKTPAKAVRTVKTATEIVISNEDIALRAYYIAERRQKLGWPGDSAGDWHEARRQLVAEARRDLRGKA